MDIKIIIGGTQQIPLSLSIYLLLVQRGICHQKAVEALPLPLRIEFRQISSEIIKSANVIIEDVSVPGISLDILAIGESIRPD